MPVYPFPFDRVKRSRACAGCGERPAPWQPIDHRHYRQCWLHVRNYHVVRAMQREVGR